MQNGISSKIFWSVHGSELGPNGLSCLNIRWMSCVEMMIVLVNMMENIGVRYPDFSCARAEKESWIDSSTQPWRNIRNSLLRPTPCKAEDRYPQSESICVSASDGDSAREKVRIPVALVWYMRIAWVRKVILKQLKLWRMSSMFGRDWNRQRKRTRCAWTVSRCLWRFWLYRDICTENGSSNPRKAGREVRRWKAMSSFDRERYRNSGIIGIMGVGEAPSSRRCEIGAFCQGLGNWNHSFTDRKTARDGVRQQWVSSWTV